MLKKIISYIIIFIVVVNAISITSCNDNKTKKLIKIIQISESNSKIQSLNYEYQIYFDSINHNYKIEYFSNEEPKETIIKKSEYDLIIKLINKANLFKNDNESEDINLNLKNHQCTMIIKFNYASFKRIRLKKENRTFDVKQIYEKVDTIYKKNIDELQ